GPHRGNALGALRIALAPRLGRWQHMAGGRSARRILLRGQAAGALDRTEPQSTAARRTASMELAHGGQIPLRGGLTHRGGDDGRIRQDPAGGEVSSLRLGVAGVPELSQDRQAQAVADLVAAGGAPPGVAPRLGRGGGAYRFEFLAGPFEFSGL